MTAKRDLKRRVRDRQARTGESYVTARRHVTEQAPPPDEPTSSAIPVVEMISLTDEAAELGFRCRVTITSTLAARVDPSQVLARVRDALHATIEDPGFEVLRAVVLRGEQPILPRRAVSRWYDESRRFVTRAIAGVGGVSETGNMLALVVADQLVVAHIGFRPLSYPQPQRVQMLPRLVLSNVENLTLGPDPANLLIYIP
jgi:hypothetical protein